MAERREPGDVGRGRARTVGDEVVEGGLDVHGLPEHDHREACDHLVFDLRWQAAAGLTTGAESFHPTVLVSMRNRLRASPRRYHLHEDTLVPARVAGVLRDRARHNRF